MTIQQRKPDHKKILVVEDEALARRALTQLLISSGYTASPVSSGEEALAVLEEGELPEIALIDFNLPGMNGLSLVEQLRKHYPSVFVVIISAAGGTAWRLFDEAEVQYLRKPINFSRLLEVLDEHCHVDPDNHFPA